MKMLLLKINCHAHCWSICSDFKVIAILLGLQTEYTKYCSFLYCWDSHARDKNYTARVWSGRDSFEPGQRNVAEDLPVDTKIVILPPPHIRLGIVKNFVKAIVRNGNSLGYLKLKFPKLSEAKIKKGGFTGPQIRELMKDSEFYECLSSEERKACLSAMNVIRNFFRNRKSKHYKRYVNKMLTQFHGLNVNTSLKINFLHSHLDFFPGKLGSVSDEHGERFHQDIATIERRYQSKWSTSSLYDYCWSVTRDDSIKKHVRSSKRQTFQYG